MIHDAKEYKLSKIVVSDLTAIVLLLQQLNESIVKLLPYKRYTYVNKLLEQYKESVSMLKIQKEKFERVKSRKGAKL